MEAKVYKIIVEDNTGSKSPTKPSFNSKQPTSAKSTFNRKNLEGDQKKLSSLRKKW